MIVLTATDKSRAKFEPTEFYMRRQGNAYFRNSYGSIVVEDMPNLEYGKKYQFTINKLVRE